jgi:acetyl esterase/lipase
MTSYRRRARYRLATTTVLIALLMAANVPVALGAAGDPAYQAVLGETYADLPGNAGTIDLYMPVNARGRVRASASEPGGGDLRVPVVMWTAGSAWMADNGNDEGAFWAERLVPEGYAVAAYAVRSSSQATFPAQIHDAKAAVRWVRAHAREYGLDPHRIAAMGNSSGGHVSSLLGTTGDVPALEGHVGTTGPSSRVQAVIDFFGPTDFLQMDTQMLPGACEFFNDLLGIEDCHNDVASPESRLVGCAIQTCPDEVAAANPISYVSKRDAPFLILHGTADQLVPHGQSQLLFNALARACVDATFYSMVGRGHEYGYIDEQGPFTDRTRQRTRHCTPVVSGRGKPATVDLLDRFLDRALDT